MRALSTVYEGRAKLEVMDVKELDADFAKQQFPDSKHGLLVYGKGGEVVAKLEGHRFGKDEITGLVDGVLK